MNSREIVENLCAKKGITRFFLEKELNMANGTTSKWANSKPSAKYARKVADYFGVSIECILGDVQQTTSYESEEVYIKNLLKNRGILKDGEDLSEENMQHLLNIIESAAKALKK